MKKIVFPGDHLGSCEEYITGPNTYSEKNEIYASAYGEVSEKDRKISVKTPKTISEPRQDMEVYGIVANLSDKRAFIDCMPVEKGNQRINFEDSLVLSVNNVTKGFLKRMGDAIRTGDIVKAKVMDGREGLELTMVEPQYGVVKAYCVKCRNSMILKNNRLKCNKCGQIENRKISKDYSSG